MSTTALFASFFLAYLFADNSAFAAVREPVVAGAFYPANAKELSDTVRGHLAAVKDSPAVEGQLMALIVPHAGLVYSGGIAAHAYKLLENSKVSKVVLCGPSHRFPFRGVALYGPGVSWRTPLGAVKCDENLCNLLTKQSSLITVSEHAHSQEHCLEVQLPYLQTVLKDFSIVPLSLGSQDAATIDGLAKALAALPLDSSTVLVASTDWQHYRPASVGGKMDSLGMECLEHLDPDRLQNYLQSDKVEACGGGAAAAVLKAAMAKGADKVKILKYGDSGDISGDKSSVVGYVAAAIYKSSAKTEGSKEKKTTEAKSQTTSKYELSDADKRKLLEIARRSIENHLQGKAKPQFDVSGLLRQPGAAFVTLEEDGMLRGCIGYTVAKGPLYQVVSECAVSAATRDPRFMPVQQQEIPKLEIEISVLTPLEEVKSLDDIQVGRDGLMIILGNYHGLLLPQVATDYGWDRTQFLEQTCRKAGLPSDAYKRKDAVIYKFQALIFSERELLKQGH